MITSDVLHKLMLDSLFQIFEDGTQRAPPALTIADRTAVQTFLVESLGKLSFRQSQSAFSAVSFFFICFDFGCSSSTVVCVRV